MKVNPPGRQPHGTAPVLHLPIADWTPRRRRRWSRALPVCVALLALAIAVALVGMRLSARLERATGQASWAELQVAQTTRWATAMRLVLEHDGQLARERQRLDQLCATLDVLVRMTPGRARLPRVLEDACEPPLPMRTSGHLWGDQ